VESLASRGPAIARDHWGREGRNSSNNSRGSYPYSELVNGSTEKNQIEGDSDVEVEVMGDKDMLPSSHFSLRFVAIKRPKILDMRYVSLFVCVCVYVSKCDDVSDT